MSQISHTELIGAYLDGELSGAELVRAERLLAENADLRQLLEDFRAVRTGMASIPRFTLEDDFYKRVLRRAEREILRPATPTVPTERGTNGPSMPGAPVARAGGDASTGTSAAGNTANGAANEVPRSAALPNVVASQPQGPAISNPPSLTAGTPSLTAGTPSLTAGTPSLTTGTPSLTAGTPSLTAGTPSPIDAAQAEPAIGPARGAVTLPGATCGVSGGVVSGADAPASRDPQPSCAANVDCTLETAHGTTPFENTRPFANTRSSRARTVPWSRFRRPAVWASAVAASGLLVMLLAPESLKRLSPWQVSQRGAEQSRSGDAMGVENVPEGGATSSADDRGWMGSGSEGGAADSLATSNSANAGSNGAAEEEDATPRTASGRSNVDTAEPHSVGIMPPGGAPGGMGGPGGGMGGGTGGASRAPGGPFGGGGGGEDGGLHPPGPAGFVPDAPRPAAIQGGAGNEGEPAPGGAPSGAPPPDNVGGSAPGGGPAALGDAGKSADQNGSERSRRTKNRRKAPVQGADDEGRGAGGRDSSKDGDAGDQVSDKTPGDGKSEGDDARDAAGAETEGTETEGTQALDRAGGEKGSFAKSQGATQAELAPDEQNGLQDAKGATKQGDTEQAETEQGDIHSREEWLQEVVSEGAILVHCDITLTAVQQDAFRELLESQNIVWEASAANEPRIESANRSEPSLRDGPADAPPEPDATTSDVIPQPSAQQAAHREGKPDNSRLSMRRKGKADASQKKRTADERDKKLTGGSEKVKGQDADGERDPVRGARRNGHGVAEAGQDPVGDEAEGKRASDKVPDGRGPDRREPGDGEPAGEPPAEGEAPTSTGEDLPSELHVAGQDAAADRAATLAVGGDSVGPFDVIYVEASEQQMAAILKCLKQQPEVYRHLSVEQGSDFTVARQPLDDDHELLEESAKAEGVKQEDAATDGRESETPTADGEPTERQAQDPDNGQRGDTQPDGDAGAADPNAETAGAATTVQRPDAETGRDAQPGRAQRWTPNLSKTRLPIGLDAVHEDELDELSGEAADEKPSQPPAPVSADDVPTDTELDGDAEGDKTSPRGPQPKDEAGQPKQDAGQPKDKAGKPKEDTGKPKEEAGGGYSGSRQERDGQEFGDAEGKKPVVEDAPRRKVLFVFRIIAPSIQAPDKHGSDDPNAE